MPPTPSNTRISPFPHKSLYLQLNLAHPVECPAQRHTTKAVTTRRIYLVHQISFLWSVCAANLTLQKLQLILHCQISSNSVANFYLLLFQFPQQRRMQKWSPPHHMRASPEPMVEGGPAERTGGRCYYISSRSISNFNSHATTGPACDRQTTIKLNPQYNSQTAWMKAKGKGTCPAWVIPATWLHQGAVESELTIYRTNIEQIKKGPKYFCK